MSNTNKYNYYITLINMCDSLDNADALITEIADDETISHNEGLKPEQIALYPYQIMIL